MRETVYRPTAEGRTTDAAGAAPSRHRALVAYLIAALLLLVPGIVATTGLRLLFDEASLVGRAIAGLDNEMQRIAFGITPRFWMGVAGALMMVVPLVYSIYKRLPRRRPEVTRFLLALHDILAFAGPLLIAYHCYFGTGSTPANVGLYLTIVVTLSGLFGHFVHTRISGGLYATLARAGWALAEVRSIAGSLSPGITRTKLLDQLGGLLNNIETKPDHVVRAFRSSRTRQEMQRDLENRLAEVIDLEAAQAAWTRAQLADVKGRARGALASALTGLEDAGRRWRPERIAAVWRYLHLPLCFVLYGAIAIHVYKVWGMDGGPEPTVLEAKAGATGTDSDTADTPRPEAAQLSGGGSAGTTAARGAAPLLTPRTVHVIETAPVAPAVPKLKSEPNLVRDRTKTEPAQQVAASTPPPPLPSPNPKRGQRTAEATTTRQAAPAPPRPADPKAGASLDDKALAAIIDRPESLQVARADAPVKPTALPPAAATKMAEPARTAAAPTSTPTPTRVAPKQTVTQPAPVKSRAAPARVAQVDASAPSPELLAAPPPAPPPPPPAKIAAAPPSPIPPPPMAVGVGTADPVRQLAEATAKPDYSGRLDPVFVREQLKILKHRSFNHDKETRFPLTGKHRRVECDSCHKTTLADTSRRCISCHRKDDVHRGRRPNCESCHVTTNWGSIRRR